MFILQDGKLYIQEKKKIVGVEIYSDKILKVKGTEIDLKEHEKLTALEVRCRYNITELTPYIFPKEKVKEVKEEVVEDEPIAKVKKPSGKSK